MAKKPTQQKKGKKPATNQTTASPTSPTSPAENVWRISGPEKKAFLEIAGTTAALFQKYPDLVQCLAKEALKTYLDLCSRNKPETCLSPQQILEGAYTDDQRQGFLILTAVVQHDFLSPQKRILTDEQLSGDPILSLARDILFDRLGEKSGLTIPRLRYALKTLEQALQKMKKDLQDRLNQIYADWRAELSAEADWRAKLPAEARAKLAEFYNRVDDDYARAQANAESITIEPLEPLDMEKDLLEALPEKAETKGLSGYRMLWNQLTGTPETDKQNDLTDTEKNILEALGNQTLHAEELLKKAGYDNSSYMRMVLSSLCKRKILSKDIRGYFRPMS